jgi:hypothetical protein
VLVNKVDGLHQAERLVHVPTDGQVVDGDLSERAEREGGREGREGGREDGREGRKVEAKMRSRIGPTRRSPHHTAACHA